jgi:hypothetical protein
VSTLVIVIPSHVMICLYEEIKGENECYINLKMHEGELCKEGEDCKVSGICKIIKTPAGTHPAQVGHCGPAFEASCSDAMSCQKQFQTMCFDGKDIEEWDTRCDMSRFFEGGNKCIDGKCAILPQ